MSAHNFVACRSPGSHRQPKCFSDFLDANTGRNVPEGVTKPYPKDFDHVAPMYDIPGVSLR